GDVILEVNGVKISTAPELQEIIARYRPGDDVKLKINSNGKEKELKAKLKNLEGETRYIAKNKNEILNVLGAEFEEIDSSTAKSLGGDGGAMVKRLYGGKLSKQTDTKEGCIITKIDGNPVRSVDDIVEMLDDKQGGVLLEGVYKDIPGVYYYAFGL